jgi:hypothetical protein
MAYVDAACNPDYFLNEKDPSPTRVEQIYTELLNRNEFETQIAIAGQVITALHPNAPISDHIRENFIDNKSLITDMSELDQKVLAHIIENFTKDTKLYKKAEYQSKLNIVHHRTAGVRGSYDSKIWNNVLS